MSSQFKWNHLLGGDHSRLPYELKMSLELMKDNLLATPTRHMILTWKVPWVGVVEVIVSFVVTAVEMVGKTAHEFNRA